MMISLESIKDYIQSLNYKEFIQLIAVYFFVIFFGIAFLIYHHFQAISDMEQKTKVLNKARQDIQMILTEYNHIQTKKNEVDALLQKDKSFYLQKYYQDTVASVNISNQTASNLITQTWSNGYSEESLQINFSQITMKQLCEFLQAVKGNERVFVKNVDIVKSNVDKKINVTLSIATLKLGVEKNGKAGA